MNYYQIIFLATTYPALRITRGLEPIPVAPGQRRGACVPFTLDKSPVLGGQRKYVSKQNENQSNTSKKKKIHNFFISKASKSQTRSLMHLIVLTHTEQHTCKTLQCSLFCGPLFFGKCSVVQHFFVVVLFPFHWCIAKWWDGQGLLEKYWKQLGIIHIWYVSPHNFANLVRSYHLLTGYKGYIKHQSSFSFTALKIHLYMYVYAVHINDCRECFHRSNSYLAVTYGM